MLVYIIVGSVREGRTAIKVANWVETAIPSFIQSKRFSDRSD